MSVIAVAGEKRFPDIKGTLVCRSNESLRNASNFLHYELGMFQKCSQGLASGILGIGPLQNAVLEAFTIHVRALLDFFYPGKSPWPDDVLAEHFIPDWAIRRPAISDLLLKAHSRVGKEVAHLTYTREKVTPETKPWDFIGIERDMSVIIDAFIKAVPRHLLGDRWNGFKNDSPYPKDSPEEI
jgi:hypothetical protein